MKRFVILLFCLLLIVPFSDAADKDLSVMRQMVERLMPQYSNAFVFSRIASDKDVFGLESKGHQICISGNNANSMAVGLNYYLKNYCYTTVSWFASDPVQLPPELPAVKTPVKIGAKVPTRFFLNYCTFGYTMPWWTWKDWERLIDWMALNGVNTPLAITGQESIWYNVWRKFGLTDTEIRSYFTGPAHLPWHRMSNIDAWQGPLPMSWLDNQRLLQKKIVERERELNMHPVLPAFAGHIPGALKRLFPHLLTTSVSQWCRFDKKYQCTFLNPMDSLYSVIQKEYLCEQTKVYGTDHIYGIDCFNEVDPPSWNVDSLALMSSHIYQSLKAVDKDAVWLQMGWLFYYNAQHWTNPRIKAFLQGVPQNKLILLDYFCDNTEVWRRTDSFFGQPFIWCYLGNFGGNTMVCGPLKRISERLSHTYSEAKSNFSGIGGTLEGLDVNQFAYEFLFDKAWNIPQQDNAWVDCLADRRVGKRSPMARMAWQSMYRDVLNSVTGSPQGTLIESFPCMETSSYELKNNYVSANEQQHLINAWKELLSIKKCNRDTYLFDVVNIGRQVLGGYFQQLRDRFVMAYKAGNVKEVQLIGKQMKTLLEETDELVACHPTFSLKQWIDKARAIGVNAKEKDYYEINARTLVTVWGDTDQLTDYARRGWSGLISNYYVPRWDMFIHEVTDCCVQHRTFDKKAFNEQCYRWGRQFIDLSMKIHYPQSGDGVAKARSLYRKYFIHRGGSLQF